MKRKSPESPVYNSEVETASIGKKSWLVALIGIMGVGAVLVGVSLQLEAITLADAGKNAVANTEMLKGIGSLAAGGVTVFAAVRHLEKQQTPRNNS